ncbi:hypothetical protein [Cesiribacter sp. SM1]|uniref:hypothetical protein n=1 Tax=Cesiribacter sp. SM1 TaxID=2861196 RepID=UPI001CD3F08C|nr:hypothetical protein [Cesiribacter sp. SM1]
MSKVIFLELRLFRNSMLETYQIRQLVELGHEVEIWHIGSLFDVSSNVILNAPAIQEYAVKIESLQALKAKVQQLEPNTIIFSMLGMLYYYPILYKVFKSRKDLIWIGRITKSLPLGSRKKVNPLKAMMGSIFFYKLYRPFSNAVLYVIQKILRKWGNRLGINAFQPDYLMVSNASQAPASFPKDRVIVTHADDYNIHLLNKDVLPDPSAQDAIVFLDQMLYYHPDFKKLGEGLMNVDTYYQKLNQVLDDLSLKYGRPVVIAGHPEADKHPDYAKRFRGKKFVVGKSLNLVKHAFLVVSHYSTATNFAVIYNKPVVLLDSGSFAGYEKIASPIKVLKKALNATIINIDSYNLETLDINLDPDFRVYKEAYIKSADTPEELSYPYAVKYVRKQINSEPKSYSLARTA